ncbi:hypothetical protein Glove_443g94 [Diversispora epigaea]|uniref:Uncharacterized protein n=1 Tax=Diversispora epigaea TaxID=1348612 RepID=A0A397GSQ2_9GLOM|nr:hypothetical protein Glove_443g94 [Diversispora epigaea]
MYLLSRKENYKESDITYLAINRYTTETYESLHKDYVKKPYKLTNKKEIEKQIMKIKSINKWVKFFIELFEEYSLSKLQFSKLHSWVFYVYSSIREFSAINRYTTETYESLHKDYVKKPYKLTNKKEIEKQIMKIICRKVIITESSSKEILKTSIALKYSKKLYEFCIQNAEIYI